MPTTPHKRKVLTDGSGVEVYVAEGDCNSEEEVLLSISAHASNIFTHFVLKLTHTQMTDLMSNWLKRLPPDMRKDIAATLAREVRGA